MTAPGLPPEPWELEGRRLAPLLDNVYAVVIAASDPRVAVQVALGVARMQSARRRVAIADLIGESPAIESLLTGDDPHGIADSFLYGVSLNKIARPMLGADNIFLMPSGTEPVDHEGVYANDRWRRLAAGFHQVGALLVVVARPTAGGFADLCGYIGTLMPVGEWAFPTPVGVPLIAPPPPPQPPADRIVTPKPQSVKARESASKDESSRTRNLIALVLLLAAVAVGVGAFWPQIKARIPAGLMGGEPAADSSTMLVPPTKMDSVPRTDSAKAGDSTTTPAAGDTTTRPSVAAPTVENPADSLAAARFAVYFATANTRTAALPDDKVMALEALALSPVLEGAELWYRVTVGAHASKSEAEALLVKMRSQKLISAGSIVTVPFALRLESNVSTALAPVRLGALKARGIVAYALRQPSGNANIYTGAFETPAQAVPLADSLRATGVAPVLVYRTGRAF
ncbi:MAG: hypothetical protein K2R93_20040 [Gemmatimonadaceae bacterium]|nr:hypothetical protein [Gemmatimonadaceae bacterium]